MRNLAVSITVSLIVAGCGGGGGGSGTTNSTPVSTNTQALPTVAISVDRQNLNVYQGTVLSWNAPDAKSCTGSGSWSGDLGVSGTKTISSSQEENLQYNITCTNSSGSTTRSVTVKVAYPELDIAGVWVPVDKSSLHSSYNGGLANTFRSLVNVGNGEYHLIVSGWGFQGQTTNQTNPKVHVAYFDSVSGKMKLNTSQYISNTLTNGAGSVVAEDFNNDGKDDIFILPLNETPFVSKPGVAYFSSAGSYKRQDLSDSINAHDARLFEGNGTKKILTSTFSENDKPRNVVYEVVGEQIYTRTPALIASRTNVGNHEISGLSNTVITNKDGSYNLVSGYACEFNPAGGCLSTYINVFHFDGYDVTSYTPKQKIIPYLTSTGKFTNYKSLAGLNTTHVYRLWNIDLNHDGNEDVLAGTSMWNGVSDDYPSMLQVLMNNGKGVLVDKTESLNPTMKTNSAEMDYSPSFVDIDDSGIKTLLFAGSYSFKDVNRQANYVLLNDGTGKLYPALHDQFYKLGEKVYQLLVSKGYMGKNYSNDVIFPKFIAVPSKDGSINFVAEIFSGYNQSQTNYYYVNVPISYNPKTDFIQNISINDRNNSNKIRTWAGDDIISDKNAVSGTKIDGGLGKNKVTYSQASTNYNVTKNNDGTYRVTNNTNNIDDTLVRIHNIVFTDKTITLE